MSRFAVTNVGMLVGAMIALAMLALGDAPLWAYGLWLAIGATTVRRID